MIAELGRRYHDGPTTAMGICHATISRSFRIIDRAVEGTHVTVFVHASQAVSDTNCAGAFPNGEFEFHLVGVRGDSGWRWTGATPWTSAR